MLLCGWVWYQDWIGWCDVHVNADLKLDINTQIKLLRWKMNGDRDKRFFWTNHWLNPPFRLNEHNTHLSEPTTWIYIKKKNYHLFLGQNYLLFLTPHYTPSSRKEREREVARERERAFKKKAARERGVSVGMGEKLGRKETRIVRKKQGWVH